LRVAVVFPGQGTQAPEMGRPWRDHPSWTVVERAEKALGEPLAPLLLDAPAEQLARTRNSQLSVLCTSLVAWDAVSDRVREHEIVAFAGHSLGQVTALITSGALAHDDGVRFAARRAEATQAAADATPGRMAALLGATPEQAEALCAATDGCWIANDNAPGQIVVAGTPEGIEQAIANAREHGIRRVTPLNVGGAFHTQLMAPAGDVIRAALDDVAWAEPSAPIVSNDDAQPYAGVDDWQDRLVRHVTVPVRWRATLETIASLGATHLVEVGHGAMIAGLAKRTIPDVAVINVATPDDLGAIT
jgi:[acyl-carrier-protein] S-malonyltransferase